MNRKKPADRAKPKEKAQAAERARPRPEPGTRMSVLLSNPDYLLEGFAEKKCLFMGVMEGLPMTADMSSRGFLLTTLDSHRNLGRLPWQLGKEHRVSLTLSAYNLKVMKEDKTGAVLHRVPIHEIASVSYVNDDDQHLVFIKAGDASKSFCPCYVFSCAKQADAEDICSILQQAFQLVYTEATMEHLNDSINAGERGGSAGGVAGGVVSHPTVPNGVAAPPPKPSTTQDGSDSSDEGSDVPAEELVTRYMERLHKLLDFKELREFATLLKRYRDDLLVGEFLRRLKELYGEQRAFLIPDMRSFIPEEDRESFESFLSSNNLQSLKDPPPGPKPRPPTRDPTPAKGERKGRRRSGRHASSHVADVDKFLQDIDAQMSSILDSTDF